MLAMESLPAMARLSLLNECAPTGAPRRDEKGRLYDDGNCQKCNKAGTRVYHPTYQYCRDCMKARERARKKADADAAAEAARQATKAEEARQAKARETALANKKAAKEKLAQDDADARERSRQLEEEAKEKRRRDRRAEKQIAEQMGDLAKKTDLEPDEWAQFFGDGPAQQQTINDAENPPILDLEVKDQKMSERARDTIKRFTNGRNEDGMQVDSEGCCAQKGKR